MKFYKYQGTGNDFIILNNLDGKITLNKQQISAWCNRRFGIGADGLMLLEKQEGYDFKMVYYNSDGGESSMCGNGGRCMVHFAKHLGLIDQHTRFLAVDGEHEAFIAGDVVKLKMQDVNEYELFDQHLIVNTGSPHFVTFHSLSISDDHFVQETQKIRFNEAFREQGINVNFIETLNDKRLKIRTYERGVEDETLSCGTGVVAAAILHVLKTSKQATVTALTLGGDLTVHLKKEGTRFSDIWLEGPAKLVFEGDVEGR